MYEIVNHEKILIGKKTISTTVLTKRSDGVVAVTVVRGVLDENQVVRLTTQLLSPYCQGHQHHRLNHYHLKHHHLNHHHRHHHHLHHHDNRWDPEVPPMHFEPTTPRGSTSSPTSSSSS